VMRTSGVSGQVSGFVVGLCRPSSASSLPVRHRSLSREAAKDCSPEPALSLPKGRKPWVMVPDDIAPKGRKIAFRARAGMLSLLFFSSLLRPRFSPPKPRNPPA